MVVKILLYCTRKCGCEGGVLSASCRLQPPHNGSICQVPVLEHETFSRTDKDVQTYCGIPIFLSILTNHSLSEQVKENCNNIATSGCCVKASSINDYARKRGKIHVWERETENTYSACFCACLCVCLRAPVACIYIY